MPRYMFSSTCGFVGEQARDVAERSVTSSCPQCDGLLSRDFARELCTITIAPVPLNFFTQWSDVYPDVSQKEMARRKGVERYDPSTSHKPTIPATRLNVPRGIDNVDALIKHLAPVDGQSETQKLLARVAPVEGERAYV